MKVAVLAQAAGEHRVATPVIAGKLTKLDTDLLAETGAGRGARISDEAFAAAVSTIAPCREALVEADVVQAVRPPRPETLDGIRAGTILLGGLSPHGHRARLEGYAALDIEAMALGLLPRNTERRRCTSSRRSPISPAIAQC